MIDAIVGNAGTPVTVRRVTAPAYDANDVLDEAASTIETEQVNAIVSSPSTETQRRLEGRVDSADLQLTVPSSTDIVTNRAGVDDEVDHDGRTYRVADVRAVDHPFADVSKKTVVLAELGGR